MNLPALQHIIRSAQSLAEETTIIVLGSASLLASFPELGDSDGPLATTYDADLLPDPFDELTAIMLHEALGENRAYFRIHGYHADILRDSIKGTLPEGWRKRLIPINGMHFAFALDPHDLAVVKLLVEHPKDISLVKLLITRTLLDTAVIEERTNQLPVPVEALPRIFSTLRMITRP